MTEEFGVNISDYTVDPTGALDSYGGFMSALSASSDDVLIPKGVYLIGQNITIPVNKKLIFGRNARLKPANGVTITINGTWVASDDDWIFDMSLGGVIGGDYKINEIRPEWLGAKGDGVTDDAKAFNNAMTLCAKKRKIILGAKTYKVRSTIENNSRGIKGVATYVDGGNSGTLISFDPLDIATDLLPCIRIEQSGTDAVFENFRVVGGVDYNSRYLSRWVDKSKFEAGTYNMFATGTVGIEVAGAAKPIFRNVQTARIKVGLLMNSSNGHITSYDCSWNGLIGVYCRRNSEDYFFQGGGISGAFCGIMLGIINTSNHRGGMSVRMMRVHMGFSPYCFYQVKDADDYDTIASCGGLNGAFESVRFERVGEACIKLLPKSESYGYYSGIGMSWSPVTYTGDNSGGWESPIPDDLIPQGDKQKYAFYFGKISKKLIVDNWDAGGAFKSPYSAGAIGVAYFDHVATDEIMLDGLGVAEDPSLITVRRKKESTSLTLTTAKAVEDVLHAKSYNPISHGQLAKNPELVSSWNTSNGATISIITDLSELPFVLDRDSKSYLGNSVKVMKITPNGINNPSVNLLSLSSSIVDPERDVCYEYFIFCETQTKMRSRLQFSSSFLYDQSYTIPALKWTRMRNRGDQVNGGSFIQVSFMELSKTKPTYIAGVMVSYDHTNAYSPYSHAYSNTEFEIGDKNGLILTDTIDGNRSKVTLTNGSLQSENMQTKTKLYSPNGIPYKVTVADDGTLSTSLDVLVYDSFDRADSATSLGNASILGGAWSSVSGIWGVSSNEAYSATAPGSTAKVILSSGVGATNYNIGCTMKGQLTSSTNYSRPGIMFKWVNTDNHFWVEFTNNAIQLCKRIGATDSIVTSVSYIPTDNKYYKVGISVRDNVITVYVDGDLKLSYKLSPSDIAIVGLSQIVGLRYRGYGTPTTIAKFNNFVVEQI